MPTIMSVDEAIEMLKRSSLPTVITEGRDDYLFFRRIEEEFIESGLDIIAVGGKDSVLSIFERRQEIQRNDVFFFVDKDFWIFQGTPNNYQHRKILMTDGYSIENDLYRDGDPESILTRNEKEIFGSELYHLICWYCFSIKNNQSGIPTPIKTHPNRIISEGGLCSNLCSEINYTAPSESEIAEMQVNYKSHFRGKNLLYLIGRQLCKKDRWPKYSYHQLVEFCVTRKGPHYQRVYNDIFSLLADNK